MYLCGVHLWGMDASVPHLICEKAGGYMLPVFFYWDFIGKNNLRRNRKYGQVQNLALTAVDNRRGMRYYDTGSGQAWLLPSV